MVLSIFALVMSKTKDITNREKLDVVISYIQLHYDEELRLFPLSKMACMSPSSFCRCFKKQMGSTLLEYITNIRLDHVEKKLRESDQIISDISFQCGFNTLSNFNRLFKKRYGCNPTEYRTNLIK